MAVGLYCVGVRDLAGLVLASTVSAQGMSADDIVDKMLKQDAFGWEEAETTIRMVLVDSAGAKRERVMDNLRRRKTGQLQSIVRFRAPPEVAGTAFLMLERQKAELKLKTTAGPLAVAR